MKIEDKSVKVAKAHKKHHRCKKEAAYILQLCHETNVSVVQANHLNFTTVNLSLNVCSTSRTYIANQLTQDTNMLVTEACELANI